MTPHYDAYLAVGAALFVLGAIGFVTRRNLILMMLSAEMMLSHLGLARSAAALRNAVAAVLKAGKPRTPDLGGTATTVQVTEALLALL